MNPALVSHRVLGYQWENEDVSTNGKVLLVSDSTVPVTILRVWDVSDPAAPAEVGHALMAGDHTSECLLDCTWAYGSEGSITDLRDPANPVRVGSWLDKLGLSDTAHDVEEIRPGFAVVATIQTPGPPASTRPAAAPRTCTLRIRLRVRLRSATIKVSGRRARAVTRRELRRRIVAVAGLPDGPATIRITGRRLNGARTTIVRRHRRCG